MIIAELVQFGKECPAIAGHFVGNVWASPLMDDRPNNNEKTLMILDNEKNVFLADDDVDDRFLFEDALSEVSNETKLTTARDGVELMTMLETTVPPQPDVIFLDLNMPRKNGFECLDELKSINKFKDIPVVIFSTSSETGFIDKVYEKGADYYLCKPGSFQSLKSAISTVLAINWKNHTTKPTRDQFMLNF